MGCGTPAGWGDGMALQIKEVHPQGIAVVKWPVNWLQETPSVLKVVGDHWPGLPASDYGPPYDLGSLRRQLQGEAPGFTDLANRVMATLLSKFGSSGAEAADRPRPGRHRPGDPAVRLRLELGLPPGVPVPSGDLHPVRLRGDDRLHRQ